ncbi:MAG TPA: 30S ribosomal protein S17 [Thermosynergistes sp.]|nr:30S ribosomal protein S17 [Thermosynergistes sp.]
MEEHLPRRKTRVGVVVSDKMDKTVVVRVTRTAEHPLYGKRVVRHKKYMAHNEGNSCRVGDTVQIEETRPLSRRKRWRVVTVLAKAQLLEGEASNEGGRSDDSASNDA